MQPVSPVLVLLTLGIAVENVAAQQIDTNQPGDLLFTVQKAPLMDGRKTRETLPAGMPLRVREIRGEWVLTANGKSGWVHRSSLATPSQAIEHFTQRIEKSPEDVAAYVIRGVIHNKTGKHQQAIADFTAAIRLRPKLRAAYVNRAVAWKNKGEYDIALKDYNHALWLDPERALTYHNRAHLWLLNGEYRRAMDDLKQAIRLSPNSFAAYNALAWIEATCPDERFRDGEKAVEHARTACRLCNNGHWYCLGTLAAAYAEAGDFKNAVRWEKKSLQGAPKDKRAELQQRLNLFQAGHAYHAREAATSLPTTTASR